MKSLALVVTDRGHLWDQLAAELAGHDVRPFQCRGPEAPGYACTFTHTGRCAIPLMADVIILDHELSGDAAGQGTGVSELLAFYSSVGAPVVLLTDDARGAERGSSPAVSLRPDARPAEIAQAVLDVLNASRAGGYVPY